MSDSYYDQEKRMQNQQNRPKPYSQIQKDMEVVDREGYLVGKVKEVREGDFLLNRNSTLDVYVPFNACTLNSSQIKLNISEDEIDKQGWDHPTVFKQI